MAEPFNIDLTTSTESIILNIPVNEQIKIETITGNLNIYEGLGKTYSYSLSQIDIDNKFIIISYLAIIDNKKNILVIIENASFICEYEIDYTIDNEGKINWNGLGLEDKLQVGDKIKIYY